MVEATQNFRPSFYTLRVAISTSRLEIIKKRVMCGSRTCRLVGGGTVREALLENKYTCGCADEKKVAIHRGESD